MLFLILGFIVGGGVAIIFLPVGIVIFLICLILSLLPLEGYEKEKLLQTVKLIKLEDTDNSYYVQRVRNRVYYACDIRKQYDLPTVAREIRCIKGKVKIYEDAKCEQPVLKVYKKKPNREICAWAPFSTKTTYVFYIPKGTNNTSKINQVEIIV